VTFAVFQATDIKLETVGTTSKNSHELESWESDFCSLKTKHDERTARRAYSLFHREDYRNKENNP
jgi:hypothetical protein